MENETNVTQKHRELAMIAIGVDLPLRHDYGKKFIETGEDPSNIYPITKRFALALATIAEESSIETYELHKETS